MFITLAVLAALALALVLVSLSASAIIIVFGDVLVFGLIVYLLVRLFRKKKKK